jgi:hypothetical protein
MKRLLTLFTNHMDAWGLAFIISSMCLIIHGTLTPRTVLLAVMIAGCYWLGFAVNDYYDAPNDAQDPAKARHNFFVQFPVRPVHFWFAFSLGAALTVLFFASFGLKGLAVWALAFFVLWAYSARPVRLKSRPVLDLLTHMLFVQTFPYALCLILLELPVTTTDVVLLVCFLLGSLAAQLEQQIRDYAVDLMTDRNFTTYFGVNTSNLLLKLVTAALMLHVVYHLAIGAFPRVIVPFGLICTPIIIHRLIRGRQAPRSEVLARLTILAGLGYAAVLYSVVILGLRG